MSERLRLIEKIEFIKRDAEAGHRWANPHDIATLCDMALASLDDTRAPIPATPGEDRVRERRLELALAEIEGRSNVTTGGHSTLAQRLEHIHALAAQALAASAPVCVCGHSKADHAEKHGWECSEECACLKYTPAPACDGYHHPQGSCPDCAKAS